MNPTNRRKQYHEQAILSATPEQLIVKLYDLGIQACHRNERQTLRAVLKELTSSLDFEVAPELTQALHNLYAYCLNLSIDGDLDAVRGILTELRDLWRPLTTERKAA